MNVNVKLEGVGDLKWTKKPIQILKKTFLQSSLHSHDGFCILVLCFRILLVDVTSFSYCSRNVNCVVKSNFVSWATFSFQCSFSGKTHWDPS